MTASHPTALYTVAEIRAIEAAAQAALPARTLMQRAGLAAAELARALLAEASVSMSMRPAILVLAGPGNNGGDALEAAALLAQENFRVRIILLAAPEKLPQDAQQSLIRARAGAAAFETLPALAELRAQCIDLVIDGLFGIGLMRPLNGEYRSAVETVNALACPVLALDVPSGLNADTGAVVGPDGIAVRASHTLTFIGDKPGLHTAEGREHAGEVHVARLDIEERHFIAPHARLSSAALFRHVLHRRSHSSHKGSFGDASIIGGAHGMSGAPILAARAAAHCGAGRVFAGFLENPPAYDSLQPELMCRLAQDLPLDRGALVVGPGLGTSRAAHDMLAQALASPAPAVIDADALNLIAAEPGLQRKTAQRKAATLLTPHPLEAARLLDVSSASVQADRMAAARELAKRFHAVAVLKGSGTVIARPDGELVINSTGNPGLATAGSGDVLSGICGALLAQGWPAWEAAIAAVWMHGAAADRLVERGIGPTGLTASELIPAVREILNRLIAEQAN